MKKVLVFLLMATILISGLAGCSGKTGENASPAGQKPAAATPAADTSKSTGTTDKPAAALIKLPTSGQNVVQTAVPLVAGEVKGTWKALGLDVKRTHYVSGPPQLEANPSGDWQIGWIGVTAANTGILKYDMKVIGLSGYDYSNMAFVRKDSDIFLAGEKGVPGTYGTSKEWKGKNIIAPVGTVVYADLMLTLEKLGLTQNDVKIINMDVSTGLQAFLKGEGDVIFTSSAYASDLAKRDGYKIIHTMEGMGAGMAGALIANRKYLSSNEDTVVKYLEGALEILLWLNDKANNEQAAKWYVQVMKDDFGTQMALEDALTNVKQIGFKDLKFYESLCEAGPDGLTGLQKEYKKFFDYHVQIGNQDKSKTDQIIQAVDSSYLKKAIAKYKTDHNIK